QAMREVSFPWDVVSAGIQPNQIVAWLNGAGESADRKPVECHASRPMDRSQAREASPGRKGEDLVSFPLREQGVHRSTPVADQLANSAAFFDVADLSHEHAGAGGQEATIFQPQFLHAIEVRQSRGINSG